ncbi:AGAP009110-PA-like protein [Anopheles sinensis]|uniref:AGAP009110-PA-like protein n=1 Tax=Anopheles sinensis TaxID=74873 RepID=A0A084VCT2_ANOSI|nr:AGAP009110-PA-like protein [Anopheles sinensis]
MFPRVNLILSLVVTLLVIVDGTVGHGFGRGYGHGGHGGRNHGHHRHGHHGRGHHHHHHNPVIISLAIYDPKGIEVYVRRPNESVEYFAVDLTVNPDGSGSPDVSMNTSEVVYGKFILTNTDVVIKQGDFLNVSWSMGFSNGNVTQGDQMLRVYSTMIRRNCSCESTNPSEFPPNSGPRVSTTRAPISSIPPWIRTTTTTEGPRYTSRPSISTEQSTAPSYTEFEGDSFDQTEIDEMDQFDCEIDPSTNLCRSNYFDVRLDRDRFDEQPQKLVAQSNREDELRVLKGIIDTLLNEPCRRGRRSNWLTLSISSSSGDSKADPMGYLRRTLGKSPKLKTLATGATRSARFDNGKILFEMETQLDKQMMLYLCKEVGLNSVKDYDNRA